MPNEMGEKRSLETEIKLTFTDAVNGAKDLAGHLNAMSEAMDKLEGGLDLKGFRTEVDKMIKSLGDNKGILRYDYFKEQLEDQLVHALTKSSVKFDKTFNTQPFKLALPKELMKTVNAKIQEKLNESLSDDSKLGLNNLKFKFYFNASAMEKFRSAFNDKLNKQIEQGIEIMDSQVVPDDLHDNKLEKVKLQINAKQYKALMQKVTDKMIEAMSDPENIHVQPVDGMVEIKAKSLTSLANKIEGEMKKVNDLMTQLQGDPKFKSLQDYKLNVNKFRDVMNGLHQEVSSIALALNNIDLDDKGSAGTRVSEMEKMIRSLRETLTSRINRVIQDITKSISAKQGDESFAQYGEWLKQANIMISNYIKNSIDESLAQLYKDLGYARVDIDGKPIWQKGTSEIGARIESATIEAIRQVASELNGRNTFLDADDARRIAEQLGVQSDATRSRIEANTKAFGTHLTEAVIGMQTRIFTDLDNAVDTLVKKYAAEIPNISNHKVSIDTTTLIRKLAALTDGNADIPTEKLDELAMGIKTYLSKQVAGVIESLNERGGRRMEKAHLNEVDDVMYAQSKKLVDFTVQKSKEILTAFTDGLSDKNFKSFTAAEKKVIQEGIKTALKDAVGQMTRTVQTAFTTLALNAEAARELEKDVEAAINKAVSDASLTNTGIINLDLTDTVNKAIKRAGAKIEEVVDAWMPRETDSLNVNVQESVLNPLEGHIKRLLTGVGNQIEELVDAATRRGVVGNNDVAPIKNAVQGFLSRYITHLSNSINELGASRVQGRLNLNTVMSGLTAGSNSFLARYTERLIDDANRVATEMGSAFRAKTADLPQNVRRVLATRGGYRTLRDYQNAVPTQEGEGALKGILDASLESTMDRMNERFLSALSTHLKGIRSAIDGADIHFNPIHGDSLLQNITGNMNRVMEEVVAKLRKELDAQFREIFKGIHGLNVNKLALGYNPPAGAVHRQGAGRRAAARPDTEMPYEGQYGANGFVFGDRMPPAIRNASKLPRDFMLEDALTRSAMITAERTKNRFRGSNLPEEDSKALNSYLDDVYLPRMREFAGRSKTAEDYRIVAPLIKQLNQELHYLVEQFRENKRLGNEAHRGSEMEKNMTEFMQKSMLKAEGIRNKFYGKLDADDLDHMDGTLDNILARARSLSSMPIMDLESLATAGRLMKQLSMQMDTVSKYYDRINKMSDFDFKKGRLENKLAALVSGGTNLDADRLADIHSRITGARNPRELRLANDAYDEAYRDHRANNGMLNDAHRENARRDAKKAADDAAWTRMLNRAYRENTVFDARKARAREVMENQAYRENDRFDAARDRDANSWRRLVNRAYAENDRFDARRQAEADRTTYANSREYLRGGKFDVDIMRTRTRFMDKLGADDLETLNAALDKLQARSQHLTQTPLLGDDQIKNRVLEVTELRNELTRLGAVYDRLARQSGKGNILGQSDVVKGNISAEELRDLLKNMTQLEVQQVKINQGTNAWEAEFTDVNGEAKKLKGTLDRIRGEIYVQTEQQVRNRSALQSVGYNYSPNSVMGYNNGEVVKQAAAQKTVLDAMANSARYMVAGSILGTPSMLLYQAYDAYKQFEDNMTKAQINFQFKDADMTSVAAQRLQSMYEEGMISTADYTNSATYKQMLEDEQADLRNKAEGGYTRNLQDLAFINGVGTADASLAYAISSRRLNDPNEAMAMTKQILKTKSLEDVDVENTAQGFEALAAQWGLSGSEMNKATNMMIKAANMTQAKIEDILDTQARAGSIFRDTMPNMVAQDKEQALATSIALSSFFVQATARSGKEGGTFFKGFLENVYKPDSVKKLQELSNLPQIQAMGLNLNPYEEAPNGGSKARDAIDVFGEILDASKQLGKEGRRQLIKPLVQMWHVGSEAAIEAFIEDSNTQIEREMAAIKILNDRKIANGEQIIEPSGKDGEYTASDVIRIRSGQVEEVTDRDIALIQATNMGTYKFKGQQVRTMFESATGDLFNNLEGEFARMATYLNAFLRTVRDNASGISDAMQGLVHVGAALGLRYLAGKAVGRSQDRRATTQAGRIDGLRGELNRQGGAINVRRRVVESQLDEAFARGGDAEVQRKARQLAPQMAKLSAEAHLLNQRMSLLDNEVRTLGIDEGKLQVRTQMVQTEFKNARVDAAKFDQELRQLAKNAGVDERAFEKLQKKVTNLHAGFKNGTVSAKNYHTTMQKLGKQFDLASAGVAGSNGVTSGMGMVQMIAAAAAASGGVNTNLAAGFIGGSRGMGQRVKDAIQARSLRGLAGSGAALRDQDGNLLRSATGRALFESDLAAELGGESLTAAGRLKGAIKTKGMEVVRGAGRFGLALAAAEGIGAIINRGARSGATDAENLEADVQDAMRYANRESRAVGDVDPSKGVFKNFIDNLSAQGLISGVANTWGKYISDPLSGNKGSNYYDEAAAAVDAEGYSSSQERERRIKAKLNVMLAEARVQQQEDIFNEDAKQTFLFDAKGKVTDVKYGNITTADEASTLVKSITDKANAETTKGQAEYDIKSTKLLLQGFGQNSKVAIDEADKFLKAQAGLYKSYGDQVRGEMAKVEAQGGKDTEAYAILAALAAQYDLQATQSGYQQYQNQIALKQQNLARVGEDFDFDSQSVGFTFQKQLSDVLLSGGSPDSAAYKQIVRNSLNARNEEISEVLPKLQAELAKWNPERDDERSTYRSIWLQIAQLTQEQNDNLVKIKESLATNMATFNLPDGIQPMTYFDAMAANSQYKNVTTRVGDVIVNVTLGSDVSAAEADKIGKSIAGHVTRAQTQQAQQLGNQVKAGYQGNYNSMIGGK